MAKRTSLREFQEYLAVRLSRAAHGRGGAASFLGVRSGGEDWLLDLADSGEIVRLPELIPVPLTRPAFAGIANIRGNLYAVTDFSLFRGGEATPHDPRAWLLLVGTRHGCNAALLVSRLLGLKSPGQFTAEEGGAAAPAWMPRRYRDRSGGLWRQLSVRELLADEDFMNVAA